MVEKLSLIKFKLFEPYKDKIKYSITTRNGGASPSPYDSLNFAFNVEDDPENVEKNYDIFCEATGFNKDKIVYSDQAHTDTAAIVNGNEDFRHPILNVDAFVTSKPGVPISVRMADCQGVLAFDPQKNVISAIHSGWKGNAQNVIGKTIRKMVEEFDCDPKNILVGISPSLGPCCAEFTDPENELPAEMHQYVQDKMVDLWACSHGQLEAEGVLPSHIENPRICTNCNQDRFFSYRGSGGVCGRMMGIIEIKF